MSFVRYSPLRKTNIIGPKPEKCVFEFVGFGSLECHCELVTKFLWRRDSGIGFFNVAEVYSLRWVFGWLFLVCIVGK